jgi:hydrophobic/amphiphilic exporter-1 (mainly G- bacteria), HAE1 family
MILSYIDSITRRLARFMPKAPDDQVDENIPVRTQDGCIEQPSGTGSS